MKERPKLAEAGADKATKPKRGTMTETDYLALALWPARAPAGTVKELVSGKRAADLRPYNWTAAVYQEARAKLAAGADFLAICGHVGTGKTGAALWATGNELPEKISYDTAPAFCSYGIAGAGASNKARAQAAPVLILEELGDEEPTDKNRGKLGQLLRHRLESGKITIICTNLPASWLVGAPASGGLKAAPAIYGNPAARRIEQRYERPGYAGPMSAGPFWLVQATSILCPGEQRRQARKESSR